METVTNWQLLMKYAKALGNARASGDKDSIAKAKKNMMITQMPV